MKHKENLKFSIITVCRNAADTIEETIKSVISQSYENYEFIIIDGKSSDKTGDIIKKYENYITKYISEKDSGIYDAMNKGVSFAHGDYVFFLNANDVFSKSTVLEEVAEKISVKNPDIIYGDILAIEDDRNQVIKFNKVTDWYLAQNTICHQATFSKKDLFEKYGDYDLKYKIAADYDWLLKMIYRNKISRWYIPLIITKFSMGGISSNQNYRDRAIEEHKMIRKKYFPTGQAGSISPFGFR